MKNSARKCVYVTLGVLFVVLSASAVFAQGTRMRSPNDPVDEKDADHPEQREQWFLHGRMIPGQNTAALHYRAHLQKMQMRAAREALLRKQRLSPSNGAAPVAGWTGLGPAPLASDATGGFQDYNWVSGRSTAVAIDPNDTTGNTVYVGGAYGGVWKSTNAATTTPSNVVWTPVIDTQATLATGSIAVQPGNSNIVLVGTGETNSSADSYYGLGLLRSTDAGSTWTLITQDSGGTHPFAGMGFSKIAFSTATPTLVVAAAASAAQGVNEGLDTTGLNRGIYYSTDSGATWHFASIKDGSTTISPGSTSNVTYNATANKFFAAIRFHGFYSSSDGINWTRLTTQPGPGLTTGACPAITSQSCPIYRGELTVVSGRNEMYAWYVDINNTDKGIYRSNDGGASWTTLGETGITACGDSFGCGTSQGFYNLELQGVANGAATDLYAGAINIYKCTFANNTSTTCTQSGGSWLNLTHVYGCSPNFGSIAKVHPDQHDLDSIIVSGKNIIYFGNDGGIYRALDGFTGLTTGTCGMTNAFDSLNQTLGSMTQFVSFSQHPTDPNTILGGTQDNGSPATITSQSSTQWLNVNAGDGGYNEINPNATNEWFTANTDVSIQKCSSGISCLAQTFPIVIDNTSVGGDGGAFYTPYILDPQNSADIIVGTCRVWRGANDGTGSGWATGGGTALSPNFEVGGTSACTGGEVNLVKTLAAGGPTSGGFSNVIYAGTDGFGPSVTTGGHVWVSTNAAGGTGTWVDRTSTINPSHFPVSSVAIDGSDATGNTAYASIMGFHVTHVWKTTNAGSTWTNFGGSGGGALPDAPADALVVDSASGVVYVGTDVGVFSSPTSGAAWTEVGPAPGTGAGYIPNVAVTALRIFNSGGTKKLRASTYGRGIWEFNLVTTPDYTNTVSNATQTIFPTQSATFNGTLTALNGYNNSVALSCTGTKPSTCTLNPTSLTPTSGGAGYTVTASGAIGDYSFNAHGVGSDSSMTTHDAALTLHIADFNITAPSPSTVTANRPNTSNSTTFNATASGSFSGTVALSCTGLPTGVTCNFSPSGSVNPTSSTPVNVTLTISTSITTPPASYPIQISAMTSGAPAPKTQNLTFVVTANPDYTLVISNSPQSAAVNSSAMFNGTLTSINGYSTSVNLSCGAGAPPTCTPSVASLVPTAGGAPFTVTASSTAVQSYNFNITGTDGTITHSAAVTFNSTFDYTFTNNSAAQTVSQGQTAAYSLDVNPMVGTFPNTVTITCSGLPSKAACLPASVSAGSGDTPVTLMITTTAPTLASNPSRLPLYALWLPLPGLMLAAGAGKRTRRGRAISLLLLVLLLMLVGLQVACGGGGSGGGGGQPGTPKGTYNVTVTAATTGAPSHNVTAVLTVQ